MEHFEMEHDAQLKLALDLLEEFIPDYQIGEHRCSELLVVCGASWTDIERMVAAARKRLGEDNGLSQTDRIAFEELISPLLSWSPDWGFEDEYVMCHGDDCRNVIGLYSEYYWCGENGVVCEECVKSKYPEEYLETLVNNPSIANAMLDEGYIQKQGYAKLDRKWCTSLHEGPRDDPEKVLKELYAEDWDKVVFNFEVDDPFTAIWSAFVKKKDNDVLKCSICGENVDNFMAALKEHLAGHDIVPETDDMLEVLEFFDSLS